MPSKGSQPWEMQASEVSVVGEADGETYPIQNKTQSAEYLRSLPHLRVRTATNALLLQLRSQTISSLSQFFNENSFVQTHPPILTSSDCEGAGEVFDLAPRKLEGNGIQHHFKTPKYLTVSTQLHLEALSHSVGNVWTLSPVFRAERSDTNRHLSEFYMLEAEQSFTEGLEDVMSVVEGMLRHIVGDVANGRIGKELVEQTKINLERRAADDTFSGADANSPLAIQSESELSARWQSVLGPEKWARMSYTDAIKFLENAQEGNPSLFSYRPTWEDGLQAEHERYLAEHCGAGGKPGPIFITDYPKHQKPFYMLPSPQDPQGKHVACFDLLLPGLGEVVGGSLREHRFANIVQAMKEHGLVPAGATETDLGPMQWYADLRRWGSVPHGGFGLGFDRFLAWISGTPNIREIVAFPRWHGRCDC